MFLASGIADSNWVKTGGLSVLLAIPAFLVPYTFAYDEALMLNGSIVNIVICAGTAMIGVYFIGVAVAGYLKGEVNIVFRVIMFIGGAMVGAAMLMKCQFLLIPISFTCIMSSVSVMLQRGYFKYTKKKYGEGRRIFKMSPLHHHFELCGMKENQIVLMYAAVTLALSVIAVLSMQLFY